MNLYHALGYWGGPFPAHVPWLHPEEVCHDITEDEIDMRFESEYQPILTKQTDYSFTGLRWRTRLHAFNRVACGLVYRHLGDDGEARQEDQLRKSSATALGGRPAPLSGLRRIR